MRTSPCVFGEELRIPCSLSLSGRGFRRGKAGTSKLSEHDYERRRKKNARYICTVDTCIYDPTNYDPDKRLETNLGGQKNSMVVKSNFSPQRYYRSTALNSTSIGSIEGIRELRWCSTKRVTRVCKPSFLSLQLCAPHWGTRKHDGNGAAPRSISA